MQTGFTETAVSPAWRHCIVKSYTGQFQQIIALENLDRAMERSARGKRDRRPVVSFLANAPYELEKLRQELLAGTYCPRLYTQFQVLDPKPRTISCADFRDRVVHHAICDVIGPLLERRFVHHSYACRVGRGTHRAVIDAQGFSRRFRFFLKLDIRRFFDSVDHRILIALLVKLFRERELQELLEVIVRHPVSGQQPGKGLPIGNLTSQWFANLYLDGADHLLKDEWGIKGYLRYMDDLVLWHDSKARLWQAHDELAEWLAEKRKLEFKQEQAILAPSSEGLAILGMRVYPGTLRLRRGRLCRSRHLVRRREQQYLSGEITEEDLARSLSAACGILSFFGLKGLISSDVAI